MFLSQVPECLQACKCQHTCHQARVAHDLLQAAVFFPGGAKTYGSKNVKVHAVEPIKVYAFTFSEQQHSENEVCESSQGGRIPRERGCSEKSSRP